MTHSIKAIIVDDEQKARNLLKGMIAAFTPGLAIVSECEDVPSAIKAIHKHQPELVFLDIEMPGYSGLELHDFFSKEEITFDIIFTTAYSEYAIQAFKLSAVDYLLKPIDAIELEAAVVRYQTKNKKQKANYQALKENLQRKNTNKLAVPSGQSIHLLDNENIIYFKADNSYTEIKLSTNDKLVVSRTLKNFEEGLQDEKIFFRCHKSYLVNLAYVKEYVKSDGGYLKLSNGETVPLSNDKIDEFYELVKLIKR